jgi:hypothetical protein
MGSRRLGLIQAWDVARNYLLCSASSGQAAMTWRAFWRSSTHWQSNDRGRKRAVYSPEKAWPVNSLIPVVTIGRGCLEIPFTNGGRLPASGFARGLPAGVAALPSSVCAEWPLLELCRVLVLSMVGVVGGLGLANCFGRDGLEASQGS